MKLFLVSDAPNNRNFVAKFENVENLSVAPISQLSYKDKLRSFLGSVVSKGRIMTVIVICCGGDFTDPLGSGA